MRDLLLHSIQWFPICKLQDEYIFLYRGNYHHLQFEVLKNKEMKILRMETDGSCTFYPQYYVSLSQPIKYEKGHIFAKFVPVLTIFRMLG